MKKLPMVTMNGTISKFDKTILGFHILLEQHNGYNGNKCVCSYCKSFGKYPPLHYGLNIPKDKSGWYVFKFFKNLYLRIT